MSVEFRIGGRVVCIHGFDPKRPSDLVPHKGSTYVIREFDPNSRYLPDIGLRFEEILNGLSGDDIEPSFCSSAFRPVRETSIDCFTALLAKPPVRLREDA